MAYFEWSSEFSVSVKEIDGQHRKLVEMVNSLYEAFLARKALDVQKATIYGMVDYSLTHFATEEKYMQTFGYPEYPAHKAEHDAFKDKAFELKERADRAGFILTIEIVDFLRSWLQNHIKGTDKRYSEFFNAHGLK